MNFNLIHFSKIFYSVYVNPLSPTSFIFLLLFLPFSPFSSSFITEISFSYSLPTYILAFQNFLLLLFILCLALVSVFHLMKPLVIYKSKLPLCFYFFPFTLFIDFVEYFLCSVISNKILCFLLYYGVYYWYRLIYLILHRYVLWYIRFDETSDRNLRFPSCLFWRKNENPIELLLSNSSLVHYFLQ